MRRLVADPWSQLGKICLVSKILPNGAASNAALRLAAQHRPTAAGIIQVHSE